MLRLNQRVLEMELMDQPGIEPVIHIEALQGIGRVNRISGIDRLLWNRIRAFQPDPQTPLRILDLACGGGDVLLKLAKRAEREGVPFTFEGADISQTAVDFAQATAAERGLSNVSFFQHDALEHALPEKYDIVMSSLFMHHLDHSQAVRLLKRMSAAATRGILLDDLLRSRLGYILAWCGVRLLTRSKMVHFDGPASVKAAFQTAEVRGLAKEAGLGGIHIDCHWPQRFLLTWKTPVQDFKDDFTKDEYLEFSSVDAMTLPLAS